MSDSLCEHQKSGRVSHFSQQEGDEGNFLSLEGFFSYLSLSDASSSRVDAHVKKDVSVAACKEECRVFEEAVEREPVA